MAQYSQQILDYFFNPQHAGSPSDSPNFFCVRVGEPKNGDVMEFYLQTENKKISSARFKAYGSPVTIAACEWLCIFLENNTWEKINELDTHHIMQELNLSKFKIHIASMLENVVKKLIDHEREFTQKIHIIC